MKTTIATSLACLITLCGGLAAAENETADKLQDSNADIAPEPNGPSTRTVGATTVSGGFKEIVIGPKALSLTQSDRTELNGFGTVVISGGTQNVSRPIPLSLTQPDLVVRSGPVAFLGVSVAAVSSEVSAQLPLPQDTGLMIEVVGKDSPADKYGLQANDVLTKFDDQILIHPRQLYVLLANKKKGDTIRVSYYRKGALHETEVTLGQRDGSSEGGVTYSIKAQQGNIPVGHPLLSLTSGFTEPQVITPPAAAPANEDLKKQVEEIRTTLEAIQEKLK